MPDIAVFTIATGVAALMLIASIRGLTWHKVSPFLTGMLLLLVLFISWQVLARSGAISLEEWGLFVLCWLVGMVAGLARGQTVPMHYAPRESDVLCRRGALLPFGWAVVVVILITLLTIPGLHTPAWEAVLPPMLVFLAAAFALSTLTVFARVSTLRREHLAQAEREQVAPPHPGD